MDPWNLPQPSSTSASSGLGVVAAAASTVGASTAHDPWAPLESTPPKPGLVFSGCHFVFCMNHSHLY